MSLTNIDKDTNDRVNPTVNSVDVQLNPMAHSTASLNPRAVGTQFTGKVTTKDSKIIGNDGTNNVGLFGFDDAGDMVVKVAQAGFDANSATDAQLIFNSQQDVFKITKKIPLTLNFTRSSSTFASYVASAAHGLTYTPNYTYDLLLDGGISAIPPSSKFSGSYVFSANVAGVFTPFGQAYCTVDATNVYFQIDISSVASGAYNNSCVIYLEQESFTG